MDSKKSLNFLTVPADENNCKVAETIFPSERKSLPM